MRATPKGECDCEYWPDVCDCGLSRAASQERPPIDVERLGWVIYEMGIDDLNLPDAEKLAAHILSRLSGSVGEKR